MREMRISELNKMHEIRIEIERMMNSMQEEMHHIRDLNNLLDNLN